MTAPLELLFSVADADTASADDAYNQLYVAAAEALNAFEAGFGDELASQWQGQNSPWSATLRGQPATFVHFAKTDRNEDPPPLYGYCLDVLVGRSQASEDEDKIGYTRIRQRTKLKKIWRRDRNPNKATRKPDSEINVRQIGNVTLVEDAEFRRHRFAGII